jgi:WhiB family transcriptional regulator, redox-sensing transcriptional regulator
MNRIQDRDPIDRRVARTLYPLPAPLIETWDWQRDASCRGMDSEVFFHPERERGASRARREATAKAICRSCPVLEQCRLHALTVDEPYGVWGGLSESERLAITRPARRRPRT